MEPSLSWALILLTPRLWLQVRHKFFLLIAHFQVTSFWPWLSSQIPMKFWTLFPFNGADSETNHQVYLQRKISVLGVGRLGLVEKNHKEMCHNLLSVHTVGRVRWQQAPHIMKTKKIIPGFKFSFFFLLIEVLWVFFKNNIILLSGV